MAGKTTTRKSSTTSKMRYVINAKDKEIADLTKQNYELKLAEKDRVIAELTKGNTGNSDNSGNVTNTDTKPLNATTSGKTASGKPKMKNGEPNPEAKLEEGMERIAQKGKRSKESVEKAKQSRAKTVEAKVEKEKANEALSKKVPTEKPKEPPVDNVGQDTVVDTNKPELKAEVKTEAPKAAPVEAPKSTETVKNTIKAKGSGMMNSLFGNLYKTSNKGRNAAVSAFSRKPIQDALNANKDYQTWSQLDPEAQQKLLALGGEPNVAKAFLGKSGQYDQIMSQAQAKANAIQQAGAWAPENREMTKEVMKDWFANNKGRALGYGMGGAMNIAGLTDNDKFGGQLLGGALGAGLGYFDVMPGGMGAVPAALLGGSIGALFDKLRAKREQNSQYNPYYR